MNKQSRRSMLNIWMAGLLSVTQVRGAAAVETLPGTGHEQIAMGPTIADYRVRTETTNLEIITPVLLRSLRAITTPSVIVGQTPWQWERLSSLPEDTVVLQVVPDLRWTGGSYARVTGRTISYPILAGVVVGGTLILAMFAALGGGDDIPDLITPSAPLWKPVHASYHFRGNFLDAVLLRDGVEVTAIEGERNCGKWKVWMARKPGQKPRWRTIRGCWGSYAFPAGAFAPGPTLEVRLRHEGKEDKPRVVSIPEELVARIRADVARVPLSNAEDAPAHAAEHEIAPSKPLEEPAKSPESPGESPEEPEQSPQEPEESPEAPTAAPEGQPQGSGSSPSMLTLTGVGGRTAAFGTRRSAR